MALWQALVAAGLPPYGLDALDILRVEKGYLVSSELNGETTPHDLDMDGLVKLGNPCVGRELLDRPAFHEPVAAAARRCPGRVTAGPGFSRARSSRREDEPKRPVGYVTSAVYSPALGEWIGLALLARRLGRRRASWRAIRCAAATRRCASCSPVHVDPNRRADEVMSVASGATGFSLHARRRCLGRAHGGVRRLWFEHAQHVVGFRDRSTTPGSVRRGADGRPAILYFAPARWLLPAPDAELGAWRRAAVAAGAGTAVEVEGKWTAMELMGPDAATAAVLVARRRRGARVARLRRRRPVRLPGGARGSGAAGYRIYVQGELRRRLLGRPSAAAHETPA